MKEDIEFVLPGHNSEINALIWNPFDEKFIASATADCEFCIWNIFEECSIMTLKLPTQAMIMQWSQINPDSIFILHKNGEVNLLKIKSRTFTKIENFSDINPTIFRLHPKDVIHYMF